MVIGFLLLPAFLLIDTPAQAAGRKVQEPPKGYNHTRFAPDADILREFRGFYS